MRHSTVGIAGIMLSAVALLLCSPLAWGEVLPRLEGKTLAGKQLILPEAAREKVALLVFGFSQESQHATEVGMQRFEKEYGSDPRLVTYSIVVLERVPGVIRGWVIRGMRHGVAKERQDRFLVLLHGEREWKKFMQFEKPDQGYLVLLDRDGNVQWRWHGAFGEAEYGRLREQLRQLLPEAATSPGR